VGGVELVVGGEELGDWVEGWGAVHGWEGRNGGLLNFRWDEA